MFMYAAQATTPGQMDCKRQGPTRVLSDVTPNRFLENLLGNLESGCTTMHTGQTVGALFKPIWSNRPPNMETKEPLVLFTPPNHVASPLDCFIPEKGRPLSARLKWAASSLRVWLSGVLDLVAGDRSGATERHFPLGGVLQPSVAAAPP